MMMAAQRVPDRAALDEAAEAMERHWPDSPGTFEALGQFYMVIDSERARGAMRRWLELDADAAMPHLFFAFEHLEAGRFEEAVASYETAIARDPNAPVAHYMLGYAHQTHADWDRAAQAYRAALRLEPSNFEYVRALAAALEAGGDKARAMAALVDFASAASAAGERQPARRAYQYALELDPNSLEAKNGLAGTD